MQVIMLHLQSVSPCRWPSTKVRTPSCFRIGVEVTTEEDAERLTQDHRVCKNLGHQGLNSGGHTTRQSTQVARRMRCDALAVASVACPQAAGAAVLELAEEAEQRANRGLGDAQPRVAQQGDHAAVPVNGAPNMRPNGSLAGSDWLATMRDSVSNSTRRMWKRVCEKRSTLSAAVPNDAAAACGAVCSDSARSRSATQRPATHAHSS